MKMPSTLHYKNAGIEIHAISDGVRSLRTALQMFPKADATVVEKHRAWLQNGLMVPHDDTLILAYRSWLIRLPEMNILFDLSIGEDKQHYHRPDFHRAKTGWLNDLGRAGLVPQDVDLVVVSHLHFDHVGWLTRLHNGTWKPTFPRTRHLTTKTELDFWKARCRDYSWMGASYDDSIRPIVDAGLFTCVDPDQEIAEGVRMFALPGHSPGMVGMTIERGGVRCVMAADVAHHPLQFREPHLSTMFCYDGVQAELTRRNFIESHADTGDLIFPIHFPRSYGRLVSTGGNVDFVFVD